MTPAGQRWTRRKPTVPGWYWFRRIDLPLHCARAAVLEVSAVKCVLGVHEDYGDGVLWHPLKEYSGEWLGPITPDTFQRGRVAGLREARDLIHSYKAKKFENGEWSSIEVIQVSELQMQCERAARQIEQAAQGEEATAK